VNCVWNGAVFCGSVDRGQTGAVRPQHLPAYFTTPFQKVQTFVPFFRDFSTHPLLAKKMRFF
jgi:hypothetical protein